MKKPSAETQLREVKRDLAIERLDRQKWQINAEILRGHLTKAQQDTAEWKRRFDLLLARVPLRQIDGAQ